MSAKRIRAMSRGVAAGGVIPYVLALVSAVSIVALITLLATLRTQEQTTVPDVLGDEVPVALLKLQERDLIPRVRLQYNNDQSTEGRITNQVPSPGANVRTGKDVRLTISRGRATFKMDSFIGQTIEQVHASIRTIESNHETSIQLGNVVYVNSTQPTGVVIEQSPLPNSDVGVFTQIDLIVSLGEDEPKGVVIPDLHNTHYEGAIEVLLREGFQFRFSFSEESDAENAYRVARQTPLPGEILTTEQLQLAVHPPLTTELGFAFGVYEYMPTVDEVFSVDSAFVVRASASDSQWDVLAEYTYLPAVVSIPYLLPLGSTIQLVLDQRVLDGRLVE